MRTLIRTLALGLGGLILMTASSIAQTQTPPAADPANTLTLTLSSGGPVTIQLLPDLAPKHVERVKTLAGEGFYNGLKFHRVIEGFMAQTGDPTGTGTGGSKYADLPAEFSQYAYKRGTV
ncbi:MAG TPA: peptidylprolyl isomerase, partial [Alphaproteobacteria bacterium]|nr:peptidylprolyl isomerase [Alphaproteobacteria bacterium]